MTQPQTKCRPLGQKGEQGFTLVELAIVMIIIGLLIGGVLKGQELIANARVAAAVSKVKAIDAALSTFQDAYQGKPGDILTPATRIPNCNSTLCAQPGNADGRIGLEAGAALANTTENQTAWSQLAAADMISGVQAGAANTATQAAGVTNPSAELSGQMFIGYVGDGSLNLAGGVTGNTAARAGHYLAIYNGILAATGQALAAGTVSLTPGQVSRVDQKMDDGLPNTGSVLAAGGYTASTATATDCLTGPTNDAAGVYATTVQGANCGMYIRIQQ